MGMIPKSLQTLFNDAWKMEENTILIGTALPNGVGQISPRGSASVYDDDHFSLWERGRGTTNALFQDGTITTVFFRDLKLREQGLLPLGGIARFYGTAKLYKSGPVYDEVWNRLRQGERQWDPDKKGFAVLIKVDRAEDLFGAPLNQSGYSRSALS